MATAVGSELTVQSASVPFVEYLYTPAGIEVTFEKASASFAEYIYTPASSQMTAQSKAPAIQYLAGSGLTMQSGAPTVQQFGGIFPVGSQVTLAMPGFVDVGNDFIPDGSEATAESGTAGTGLNLPVTLLPLGAEYLAQSTLTHLTELLLPSGAQVQMETTLVTGLRLFPLGGEYTAEKTLSIVTLILVYPIGYTGDVLMLQDGTLGIPGTATVVLTIPATERAALYSAS